MYNKLDEHALHLVWYDLGMLGKQLIEDSENKNMIGLHETKEELDFVYAKLADHHVAVELERVRENKDE